MSDTENDDQNNPPHTVDGMPLNPVQKNVADRKNPLEGITLEKMVTELVENYGWARLAEKIKIKCFVENPSVKSSLTFLRKTDWARTKVEELYIKTLSKFPEE